MWETSSQAALLQVQPQYMPGQVAYAHEAEEYAAEQANQNGLRDAIWDAGEGPTGGVDLTPAQGEKWETRRLRAQFTADFGALTVSDEEKAKVDGIVGDEAKTLAAAKDKAGVAAAKGEFTKKVLAILDDARVANTTARGGARRAREGDGEPAVVDGVGRRRRRD